MKAFPSATGAVGMELRDYFAAQAIPAVMADPDTLKTSQRTGEDFTVCVAVIAYRIADEMMKARQQNG
jgi:hypothetical protein